MASEATTQEHVHFAQECSMLMSALMKMASACPDLIPRVLVFLASVLRNAQHLHAAIVQRAHEYVRLCKYPRYYNYCVI